MMIIIVRTISSMVMATRVSAARRPSARQVTKALRELSVEKTRELVFQLGVPISDIDDIDTRDTMVKARLVQKWLDMDATASWGQLVAALRDISMDSLAADVEKTHVPRPSNPSSATESSRYEERAAKIVTCGDFAVGKTTLISKFTTDGGDGNPISSTIGLDYGIKTVTVGGRNVKMVIWDTGGLERFEETLEPHYYRRAEGVVLMYDVTNEGSFHSVPHWIADIRAHTIEGNVPIVLVGNKVDLEDKREVSMERGRALADEHRVWFFETSALTNLHVAEPFECLASQILERESGEVEGNVVITLDAQTGAIATRLGCCDRL